MKKLFRPNTCRSAILTNSLLAVVSLFFNGIGIYFTIRASIGLSPWDVFNTGLSKTFGILYGNASVIVSFIILIIDLLLKEPIGISMFIDAIVVGKSVDFCNWINLLPEAHNIFLSLFFIITGIFIIAYTQAFYMHCALGCGPRDTLLIGLKKRLRKIPIGLVNTILLAVVTLIGFILGGKVGIGTIILSFGLGPVLQLALRTFRTDAASIEHQHLLDSFKILLPHRRSAQ